MDFIVTNLNIILPAVSAVFTAVIGAYLGYRYARKKAYLSEVAKDKVKAYREISSQLEKHYQWFHKINQAMIHKMFLGKSEVKDIPYRLLFDSHSDNEKEDISRFLIATHELSNLISACAVLVDDRFFENVDGYISTFRNLPTPEHISDSWKLVVDILLPTVGDTLRFNDFRESLKNKALEIARKSLDF